MPSDIIPPSICRERLTHLADKIIEFVTSGNCFVMPQVLTCGLVLRKVKRRPSIFRRLFAILTHRWLIREER